MLKVYQQLKVAKEPYGIHAQTDEDIARQLACIVRYEPQTTTNGLTLVTGSLVNKNPVDNQVIVDSYLEWLGVGVTNKAIKQFISHYAETLIQDRKSTRLNSSHVSISYSVFCLNKKT